MSFKYRDVETLLKKGMETAFTGTMFEQQNTSDKDRLEIIWSKHRQFVSETDKDQETPKDRYWNTGIWRPVSYLELGDAICRISPDKPLNRTEEKALCLFRDISLSVDQLIDPLSKIELREIHGKKLLQFCQETMSKIEPGTDPAEIFYPNKMSVASFGIAMTHGKENLGVYLRFTNYDRNPEYFLDPKYSVFEKIMDIPHNEKLKITGVMDIYLEQPSLFADAVKNNMKNILQINPALQSYSLSPKF